MPIFAYLLFGLIAITIIVMIVINFMYHNIKKLREDVEERYYRNLKRKEQKEKNPFGEDYFKSSRDSKNNSNKNNKSKGANQANQSKSSQEEETTTRKTTTSDGVTIIDDRNQEKKIFDSGDGEYVEFEEV